MSMFHNLTIANIKRETQQSVSIAFQIPAALKDTFKFQAGQYITLEAQINNTAVRRAYSICSAPNSNELRVAIKAVPEGVFSTYANSSLQEGDTLAVSAPEGRFVLDAAFAKADTSKNYAAFAAGSGITPILSMIKTVLSQSNTSKFVLVYGNKSTEEAMFKQELLDLKKQHPERLSIEWVCSQSREDGVHFGRILKSTVNFVVKNKYQDWDFSQFYVCGPEAMITEVSDTLMANGVAKENVLFELFTSSTATAETPQNLDGNAQVTVIVDDESFEIHMPQDGIILDAALKQEIDAPYSCQGGICSSCIARVTEGTATMRKNQILTDQELAEGLILTCQAHPTSAQVTINYDEV